MKQSSFPDIATPGSESTPKLLACSSEGSPTQRKNVHTGHGPQLTDGTAMKNGSFQKASTEPLAVKLVKSMPNLPTHEVHGGPIHANGVSDGVLPGHSVNGVYENSTHANGGPVGVFPGPSTNGVPNSAMPGPQGVLDLPYTTADVNGRPVQMVQPVPITSSTQPQAIYPHVGYIPHWDPHAYMTGMPGTGPMMPHNIQQAPWDLVMHNWNPETAPPIPVEAVPRDFVWSHFAYHPVTGQHCAVWTAPVTQYPSDY